MPLGTIMDQKLKKKKKICTCGVGARSKSICSGLKLR